MGRVWSALALVFLLLSIVFLFFLAQPFSSRPELPAPAQGAAVEPSPPEPAPEETARALREKWAELDRTVWAKELQAQKYEETVVWLWDELLRREDKIAVLASFPFSELAWGKWAQSLEHDWGIHEQLFRGQDRVLSPVQWKEFLAQKKEEGFQLVSTEWHQSKFDADPDGSARSVFSFVLYVRQPVQTRKLMLKGDLEIRWTASRDAAGRFLPGALQVQDLKILEWQGPAVFEKMPLLDEKDMLEPPWNHQLDPVQACDLNGDGRSDLLVGGCNLILWNRGGGHFEKEKLPVPDLLKPTDAALVADFTGDGLPDLLAWQFEGALLLYPGKSGGGFSFAESRQVFQLHESLKMPLALTAGDIDGDGHLDLFISQYRVAYGEGQFPKPYYDSNDGFPAYLLRNKGNGAFEDVTEAAGLAPKRYRRTFSCSFLELNGDGHLDLLVVSDYAGIDAYVNDGHGHFTEVTEQMFDERAVLGMSHALADFNLDGRLDVFVTGMSSTTARRLEHMKLGRPDLPEYNRRRMLLGYGNRMYLAQPGNVYRQPSFKDHVARTGWSWGSTTLDFDNDGDPDLYVANGNLSGKSTKDHCTQFWRHDIYTGNSQPNAGFRMVFMEQSEKLEKNLSWDGYQHNALLMNESGKDFLSVAFLMDADRIEDCRVALSADLDLDGKPDLVVSCVTPHKGLFWLRNRFPTSNHWIGVRLQEQKGCSPQGAQVSIYSAAGKQVAAFVTGDSYRCQHPLQKHFGLGSCDRVEALEVRWVNGQVQRLPAPVVDRYHLVVPPP